MNNTDNADNIFTYSDIYIRPYIERNIYLSDNKILIYIFTIYLIYKYV